MQVRFDEIPAEGLRLEIRDAAWFPVGDFEPSGPVGAELFLERRDNRVFVQGRLEGRVRLVCDRCLVSYEFGLDHDFAIDAELMDPETLRFEKAEHACDQSEMDVLFLATPAIDVGEVLAQEVFFSLPAKRICSEACQGLCPRCGANLNKERCACGDAEASSPFAALKQLKH